MGTAGRFLGIISIVVSLSGFAYGFSGGDGTAQDPYQISTPEHLISIGSNPDLLDKHYIMVADVNMIMIADVNMAEYMFDTAVIAPDMDSEENNFQGISFTGLFNGNNHIIQNLHIDTLSDGDSSNDNNGYLGLFGQIGENGQVMNLKLSNVSINCSITSYVSSLAGVNQGTISNCHSYSSYIENGGITGDIAGYNDHGNIVYCCSENFYIQTESPFTGGIAGINRGNISNCCSVESNIISSRYSVGGLIGLNEGHIKQSYSTSDVEGDNNVGGLVGYMGSGTLADSYSTGTVTGNVEVGGLIGDGWNSSIRNCYSTGYVNSLKGSGLIGDGTRLTVISSYWDMETSGKANSDGGIGKTTEQMQDPSTFINAGWALSTDINDPNGIWQADPYDYPKLVWQDNPFYIDVPTLVNLSKDQAEGEISGSGFITGNISYQYSDTFDKDHVIYQYPPAGESALKGTPVNIVISIGHKIYAPDVTGMSIADANSILNDYGLVRGDIVQDYSLTVPEGLIISQLPSVGELTSLGSSVDLVVSLGIGIWPGSGTEGDPYQVSTADQLVSIGDMPVFLEKHYILTADIDLSGYGFTTAVIASGESEFTGTFDGDGYNIINLKIASGSDYLGFFGKIGETGEIRNLGIRNVNIEGGSKTYNAGAISGLNSGTVTFCNSSGMIKGYMRIGGLMGKNLGEMTGCYFDGSVEGSYVIGGLVGDNRTSGIISFSYSTGTVTGETNIGGIAGGSVTGAKIINCYSDSSIEGVAFIGGLVGSGIEGYITNCYAVGSVYGTGNSIGGLVGTGFGLVVDSFWDIETTGMTKSIGGVGKTTAEMRTMSTYIDAGWPFDTGQNDPNTWQAVSGWYPRLTWQGPEVDLIVIPDVVGSTYIDANDVIIGDAYNIITDAGFTIDDVKYTYSDVVPADIIVEQFPYGGLLGKESDPIDLVVSLGAGPFAGDGSEGNPYRISTVDHLLFMRDNELILDKYCILMNDIDMTGYAMETALISPCKYDDGNNFNGIEFTGVFDGGGHKIMNLNIAGGRLNLKYLGLFGRIGETGIVRNLGVENMKITSGIKSLFTGGLCSTNYGVIINCYTTGWIYTSAYSGGLVGENYGEITFCYSSCDISGDDSVGGLAGVNRDMIVGCYSVGKVRGDDNVGGLIGTNARAPHYSRGIIANCYSTSSVSGHDKVGGLVGTNGDRSDIINCYSTGLVSGGGGGLVAYKYQDPLIANCFWDIETSGRTTSVAGTGLTTAQMQRVSTYTDAGWDFSGNSGDPNCWQEVTGWYPLLAWQSIEDIVEVPDVIDSNSVDAVVILKDAGFCTVNTSYIYSDTIPVDHIINQSHTAGEKILKETLIDLDASLGKAPPPVKLPDVTDVNYVDATDILTNAGLELGYISQRYSNIVPEGNVISQSPAGGQLVIKGSEVDLVLSRGGGFEGVGDANEPYLITNAEDIMHINSSEEYLASHFVMTTDIDMSGHVFSEAVIGPDTDSKKLEFK